MQGRNKVKLTEVASVIRSKNAGPYELTFDLIFREERLFQQVTKGGTLTKQLIADIFQIDVSQVFSILAYPPAKAIKITIERPRPSGSLGETDVYGAQQHGPLLDLEVFLAG